MRSRSKIVCTLGPAVATERKIQQLIRAGMNVARINCSHGTWEERKQWIQWVRKHSPDVGAVAILVDLQGPKFRLSVLPEGVRPISVGSTVVVGPTGELPLRQPEILSKMAPRRKLLLGDGDLELRILRKEGDNFVAKALTSGVAKTKQGVTLVGVSFETTCLTEKDYIDVQEGIAAGADILALSYVHRASDIVQLRELADKYDKTVRLCAKIETRQAIENIREITRVSDVVMIARGDMGLQMNIEDVPIAQKKIIAECREQGKPVITATQMLESMISAGRPTRAEATDVANAILDGSDAVMLSGETAAGLYPIASCSYMRRIADKAERMFDYTKWMDSRKRDSGDPTMAIAFAVAQLASVCKPKAIVTTSTSGQTARLVSNFRPKVPIYCATWSHRTRCALAVVWGVTTVQMGMPSGTDEQIENAIESFRKAKMLKSGDQVIVSAGVPAGTPGNTNLILLTEVGSKEIHG
jgi:pyruvate kinase